MQEDQILTKSEAAKELNISRPTLDRWIKSGKIPQPILKGNTYLFTREQLENALQRAVANKALRPAHRMRP